MPNFIEIALRHGCSPVNLLHIFRTPFPMNASGWLLLSILDENNNQFQLFSKLHCTLKKKIFMQNSHNTKQWSLLPGIHNLRAVAFSLFVLEYLGPEGYPPYAIRNLLFVLFSAISKVLFPDLKLAGRKPHLVDLKPCQEISNW